PVRRAAALVTVLVFRTVLAKCHCDVARLIIFILLTLHPQSSTLFPYTTLFRSHLQRTPFTMGPATPFLPAGYHLARELGDDYRADRKSTRLNSSHGSISYAVFCLKKKKQNQRPDTREDVSDSHSNTLIGATTVY